MDFHNICTAGTSKLIDVQCKFMFKSDRKFYDMVVLKLSHKHAPSEVMVLIQNFLFLHFISQLLLKLGF